MTPIIVLVLRSGGDFKPEHVLRLWSQVYGKGRWHGHVVCLTDTPSGWCPAEIEQRPLVRSLPGWWSKVELCAPEHDGLGDILYLDLDTTIIGSLEDLTRVRQLVMLEDFLRPGRLASGVMYLPLAARREAWRCWPGMPLRRWVRRGDQAFFSEVWPEATTWQHILPGQLVSFKEHVLPSGCIVPWDARVICYHGHPRPWEVECA